MSVKVEVETMIQESEPAVQALARQARQLMASVNPKARQEVSLSWGGYLLFKQPAAGGNSVCWVTAHKKHISLGFSEGAELSDPAGLLEGKGKHSRHVKVKTPEQLALPELRELIAEAWSRQPDADVVEGTLEQVREICLSLPGTSETVSHGHPNFWAGKKTFAVYGIYSPSVAFKAGFELHAELEGDERITPTPYMAHNGWLSLRLDESTDWTLARRLLLHSYRQVATKKLQAELES